MAAEKIFAHEIVAYSDEELDRYLEENERFVRVHDPKNLPESFIQRLRDRTYNPSRSRPVDLDQVSARLLKTFFNKQTSSKRHTFIERRARRRSLSIETFRELRVFDKSSPQGLSTLASFEDRIPDFEEKYQREVAWEKGDYNKLINDGGRPWYPIHLLEEVSKNPRKHRELLRAWQPFPDTQPDDWCVFGRQMLRWIQFREWQAKRRTEHKGRISDHTQWAKRFLLNKHCYTAPVEFEFKEDPKQQDQLTTFIEYLTYEYNFYTSRYAWHELRGKWYDKQWKKLVDSGVLRPYETEEFVLDLDSAYYGEEIQAEKTVESARSAVSSAQETIRDPPWPSPVVQQRLDAAQSKLKSAIQSFESTKRRHNLISKFLRDTYRYRDAKCNAERHTILLQWIREQISLIELELKQYKIAESSSNGRKGRKRGLERCQDEIIEDRSPKKQKWNAPDEYSLDDIIDDEPLSKRQKTGRQLHRSHIQTPDEAEAATIKQREKSTRNAPQSSTTTQPLRRSARIAALQEAAQTVITRSGTTKSPLRRSRRKITQAPALLLSTESQNQYSRLPATKMMKQSARRGNRHDISKVEGKSGGISTRPPLG